MSKTLAKESVDQAVEITKAAAPMGTGSVIFEPEKTAKFIEVVAETIQRLRYGQQ